MSRLLRIADETLQFEYDGGAVTPVRYPYASGWRTLSAILVVHVDGTFDLQREGELTYRTQTGQVVCVPPETPHLFEVIQRRQGFSTWSHVKFTICSTIPITDILLLPLTVKGASARRIGEINRELSELATEACASFHRLFRRKALAFELLCLLTEKAEFHPQMLDKLGKLERLATALSYLKENFHTSVKLSDLAGLAGLSPSRFHAVFESAVGQPPGRYLQSLRLQRARQLLFGEGGIAEIAFACGYQDVFHFSRIFKKHFGLSPSAYRQHQAQGF